MLDLLIAILIALGCSVNHGTTQEELQAEYAEQYEKAKIIMETGAYKETEGGVVIVDVIGD